jgi:hypothetical protein
MGSQRWPGSASQLIFIHDLSPDATAAASAPAICAEGRKLV